MIRTAFVVAAVAVLMGASGCTVTDDVVTDIGTVQVVLVDPDLATQVARGDPTIQAVTWEITDATLDIEGAPEIQLQPANGSTCAWLDTALVSSRGIGTCATPFVIDTAEGTRSATVSLTLNITLYRVEPVPPGQSASNPDWDGDGVPNESDNCPLQDNPEQFDRNADGFGDACSLTDASGFVYPDTDLDGIVDLVDNCPLTPNPDQANELPGPGSALGFANVPDAMGDACTEQTIALTDPPEVSGTVDITLSQRGLVYILVDLSDAQVLSGCVWPGGGCTFDASAVRVCTSTFPSGGCS